jgi:hypothetical protein
MASDPHLSPASADEIAETLAFALRYDGRKRVHDADLAMGRNHGGTPCAASGAVWLRGDEEAASPCADHELVALAAPGAGLASRPSQPRHLGQW